MYTLAKVIFISNLPESKWVTLDDSTANLQKFNNFKALDFSVILGSFRKVYLILTNVYLNEAEVCVDINSLKNTYGSYLGTLTELLVTIGNTPLEHITLPTIKTRYARYFDAFAAGYKVDPTSIFYSFDTPIPTIEKESLRLYRPKPDTDMNVFYKNCLVTVNGYIHKTDCDGNFVYVINGMRSSFKSRQNQIGVWSFLDVGQIEQIAIKPDMIFSQGPGIGLKDKAYVTVNKDNAGLPLDLTNKSVFLILGGYLIILDGRSFYQTNNNTFAIDFNKMPFVDRLYESFENLDLASLNLPISTDNPTLLNVNEIFSDNVLRSYLTLSQSFFVIVDSPELFVNRINVRNSNLPGMYTSPFEPKYPLFINNGRIAEYWKVEEDLQWSITVYQNYLVNRVFSYKPNQDLGIISDARVPGKPYTMSEGVMLEIGRDF